MFKFLNNSVTLSRNWNAETQVAIAPGWRMLP